MSKNIKRIQAALNILDPDQARMYQYVKERTNESAYLKRLIQRDMEGGIEKHKVTVTEQTSRDKEMLKELIL